MYNVNPSAHDLVIRDILDRKSIGLKTYGRELNTDSPEDMLQYAYEEALDLAFYLRNEISKREELSRVVLPISLPAVEQPKEEEESRGKPTKHWGYSDSNTPTAKEWASILDEEILPTLCRQKNSYRFCLSEVRNFVSKETSYKEVANRINGALQVLRGKGVIALVDRLTWEYAPTTNNYASVSQQLLELPATTNGKH